MARTKIGVDINDHDDTACANNDIVDVDSVTASDKNDDSNFFLQKPGTGLLVATALLLSTAAGQVPTSHHLQMNIGAQMLQISRTQ